MHSTGIDRHIERDSTAHRLNLKCRFGGSGLKLLQRSKWSICDYDLVVTSRMWSLRNEMETFYKILISIRFSAFSSNKVAEIVFHCISNNLGFRWIIRCEQIATIVCAASQVHSVYTIDCCLGYWNWLWIAGAQFQFESRFKMNPK